MNKNLISEFIYYHCKLQGEDKNWIVTEKKILSNDTLIFEIRKIGTPIYHKATINVDLFYVWLELRRSNLLKEILNDSE